MSERHAWEQTGRYTYRCTRCGMTRDRQQAKGDDLTGMPPAWVNRFERRGSITIGKTPPCTGTFDPATEPATTIRDDQRTVTPHRGGCMFCRWWAKAKCTNPAYPMPLPYSDAREPGQPCGPNAALWAYLEPL